MKIKMTLQNFEFNAEEFDRSFNGEIRAQFKLALIEYIKAVIPLIPIETGFLSGAFKPLERVIGYSIDRRLATRAIFKTARLRNNLGLPSKLRANNLPQPQYRYANGVAVRPSKVAAARARGTRLIPVKKGGRFSGARGTAFQTSNVKRYYYPSKGSQRVLKTKESGLRYVPNKTEEKIIRETILTRRIGDKSAKAVSRLSLNYPINISYYDYNDQTAVVRVKSAPWFSQIAGLAAFNRYFKNIKPLGIDKFIQVTELVVDGETQIIRKAR